MKAFDTASSLYHMNAAFFAIYLRHFVKFPTQFDGRRTHFAKNLRQFGGRQTHYAKDPTQNFEHFL